MESPEPGAPMEFAEENGLTTEVVLSGDDRHAFFAAGNLPSLAVVDASGRSYAVAIGFHGEGSVRWTRQLIAEALARRPATPSDL